METKKYTEKLSPMGKKIVIGCYRYLYEMVEKGIDKRWESNVSLTLTDLDMLFDRIHNDTYDEDFMVKNFVRAFTPFKWADLIENSNTGDKDEE